MHLYIVPKSFPNPYFFSPKPLICHLDISIFKSEQAFKIRTLIIRKSYVFIFKCSLSYKLHTNSQMPSIQFDGVLTNAYSHITTSVIIIHCLTGKTFPLVLLQLIYILVLVPCKQLSAFCH